MKAYSRQQEILPQAATKHGSSPQKTGLTGNRRSLSSRSGLWKVCGKGHRGGVVVGRGICDFLKEGESRLTRQLPLCLSSRRCGPSLGLGRRTIAGPSPHEMVMVEGWLRAMVREKPRCGIVLVGGVGGWVSPRGKRGGRRSGRAEGDGEDVEVPVAAFSMLWPLASGPR